MWSFELNGDILPVTNLYDIDGEETDDPAQADRLIAMLPTGEWAVCVCVAGKIKPMRFQ